MKGIGTRGKGGAALVSAIVFVFFLTLFGLAFYRLGETDIDLVRYNKDLSQALYASEAGIDKVRWMIRESHQIPGANPFSNAYVEANALAIANPTGGDFFPGEQYKPYFKVSMIKAEVGKGKVQVQVLGSVDVDGDGETGLTPIGDGKFDPDPDDVNRTFEAYIGLPGTLGERIGGKGISAAADAFYAGGIEVSLQSWSGLFKTPDGDRIRDRNGDFRFLYFLKGTYEEIWDRWGFIFSDPAQTVSSGEIDEVEFPTGIFDESGDYVDEDTDGIPDYFQDLSLRTYAGNQTFTSSVDPTAGAVGRDVIYVDGDITIDGVDFGHLNDQGQIRNCDWECDWGGKRKADLAFIANGDITVDRVDCGNVGRLVLVAKNIILKGDYNTKVNGIAIAYNDITLDGGPFGPNESWCEYEILTNPDTSRPVKYTAYFLGSMLAGNHIKLQNPGWTVIYDENVINGNMYSSAVDSILKPTLTYERVEAEDFNTSNNWQNPDWELREWQENYLQEDIDNAQADYADEGIDGTPELMKIFQDQSLPAFWGTPPDFAVSDSVFCDFTDVENVFEDSDISIGSQNWDNYPCLHFYIALDNWVKIFGSKSTLRESSFQLRLQDAEGNWITFPLSYPNNDWVAEPGKVRWKLIRITPQLIDPLSDFDLRSVVRIEFHYNDVLVSWYINDFDREWIRYDGDTSPPKDQFGTDGHYYYNKFNGTDYDKYPIQFKLDASNRRQLYYEDPPYTTPGTGTPYDIQWNLDPSTLTLENMYFEDTLDPLKSALDSVLKIDRIELPGKPATNDHLEYGLPHCLRLEVSNWREL